MAASEVTPVVLSRAAAHGLDTGDRASFDSATGFYVDWFDTAQNNQQGRLVLVITGDSAPATAGGIKIKTSTKDPFTGSGMDDLALDLATANMLIATAAEGRMTIIGPLETARFVDTAGKINVEYDTDHAGQAHALYAHAIVIP